MWIVIGMANTQELADNMQSTLETEGLLVKQRTLSPNTKSNTIEVLVLESEADSAREILLEKGM